MLHLLPPQLAALHCKASGLLTELHCSWLCCPSLAALHCFACSTLACCRPTLTSPPPPLHDAAPQSGALFDSLTVGENVGFLLHEHTNLPVNKIQVRILIWWWAVLLML